MKIFKYLIFLIIISCGKYYSPDAIQLLQSSFSQKMIIDDKYIIIVQHDYVKGMRTDSEYEYTKFENCYANSNIYYTAPLGTYIYHNYDIIKYEHENKRRIILK